jgi:hypothetical protein
MFRRKFPLATLIAPIAMAAAFGIGVSSAAESRPDRVHPAVGIFSYSFAGALHIDITHETVTLPLHKGKTRDGRTLWYVITDSSDQADAKRRGVNYSNKMLNALGTAAVQKAQYNDDDTLIFEGTVDFGLTEVLVGVPLISLPKVPLLCLQNPR